MGNEALIGKTIGRYTITDHLGRGGMAEVYKAYQPSLDRYVAIKLMHGFLADEKEFLVRFEREAKVVATLRHPNIVQVHDFDVDNGVYYMVMEFITGDTLKSRLQGLEEKGEWVSTDDAARITLAVGSALKYAHERGMVHRDVKPANVMITEDGQVILTDFGIAKIVTSSNLTASGAMVGTPSYMAPEQGMGQPGDERSDIYSLGVMLYQLMIGRLPYDADTPLAVVLKHINDPLPIPRSIKPDLPESLELVILKSLAKNPADRYQKVGELMAALRQAMGMPVDDSAIEATSGSSIKLSGASVAGRVSGLTPPPHSTGSVPMPTQIGSVAGAAVSAEQKKRSGPLIPILIGVALIVIAAGVFLIAGGGGAAPTPTPTSEPTATGTATATATATSIPGISTYVLSFNSDQVELRDKPGTDPSSKVQGLLPKSVQFNLRARTDDFAWLRIETPDGTAGWVDGSKVDLGGLSPDLLQTLPVGTTLTLPTDTPTPTLQPTETPTITPTPLPTRTPGPTKAPATAKPVGPTTAPTKAASTDPLGYGFEFKFCTYDGDNYTCNLTVWGNGGTGSYFFALENPDTGNWDQQGPGNFFNYLMRSRRCRIKTQQLRVWDTGSSHIEPNITMSPEDIASLFPGGAGCTP